MMQTLWDIIAVIGTLGSMAVVAGGVALGLFKVFGESLIQHKFDKELETFKDEHAKEMEHLRYQISGLLDRTTKLNDMEFKVVPEAWGKATAAFNHALAQTASGRMVHSLEDMDGETLEDFLKMSPLLDSQKNKVRAADQRERDKLYYDFEYFHRHARAEESAREFSIYLLEHAIFLRDKARFTELDTIIWAALRQHHLVKQYPDMRRDGTPAILALDQRGKELIEEIETDLRSSLWSTDLTPRPTLPA